MKNISSKEQGKFVGSLLIGWLIILAGYLLIRIIFLALGFHQSSIILGALLATIPYVLTAVYFWKVHIRNKLIVCIGGIIVPCIAEKIILYFLGAALYDISPEQITAVFRAVSSHEPYINLFPQQSALYVIDISFLGSAYILGSIVFSVLLVVFLLNQSKQ